MAAALHLSVPDEAFREAGADIAKDDASAVADADVVLSVRRPSEAVVKALKPGAVIVGLMDPHGDPAGLKALAEAKTSVFAMDLMPRISRLCDTTPIASAGVLPFSEATNARISAPDCVALDRKGGPPMRLISTWAKRN